MGIDIAIQGRFAGRFHKGGAGSGEALHELAKDWWGDDLLGSSVHVDGDISRVFLVPHPLSDPVELMVSRGAIEVSARTSTVGPGFHERVCDFFHHLEAVAGVEWDPDPTQDETEFFTSGSRAKLEEAMFLWLGGLCRMVLEHVESETRGFKLCMPVEPTFLYHAAALTPTGPRSIDWLKEVARHPSGSLGRSFFSSWHGDRHPQELLNRAMAHMWMDLHWVPPQSEHTAGIMERTADLLAEAYRGDPSLDYPWAEWTQILECLDRSDDALAPVVQRQAEGLQPVIGYRRGLVCFSDLPGHWSMVLPGRFEPQWEDDETWMACDSNSVVRASAMQMSDSADVPPPLEVMGQLARKGTLLSEWVIDNGRGAAVITREQDGGDEYWLILAAVVCASDTIDLAEVSIATDDPEQPWIIQALRSIQAEAEDR